MLRACSRWKIHRLHVAGRYLRLPFFGLCRLQFFKHIVDAIHKHHITHVMEHSRSAPNERVLRATQLATLSFNHPSFVLTADVFQYLLLLTLLTPRGVTDLYLSWGINIEHARKAYHKTCGTGYQQPYRRCNSQTPYYEWNIAHAPNERVWLHHAACKVEFQPPIGRTRSWSFSIIL